MVAGPGGQEHTGGLPHMRKRTYSLCEMGAKNKRQLSIRRDSKMEGRGVEVAQRTVPICWVKLVIS